MKNENSHFFKVSLKGGLHTEIASKFVNFNINTQF